MALLSNAVHDDGPPDHLAILRALADPLHPCGLPSRPQREAVAWAAGEVGRLRGDNRRLRSRLGLMECLADAAVGVFGRETNEPAGGDAPGNAQEAHHGPPASGTTSGASEVADALATDFRAPGTEAS